MRKLIYVTKKQVTDYIKRYDLKFNTTQEFIDEVELVLNDFRKDDIDDKVNSPNQTKFYNRVLDRLKVIKKREDSCIR